VASDELPDGLVVAGADGRVVVWNSAAVRITGIPAMAALGHPLSVALPLDNRDGRRWWECIDPWHGLATRTGHRERSLMLPSGREVLVTARFVREQPLGPVVRVVVGLRDAGARLRDDRNRAELVSTVAHELRSPADERQGLHRDSAGQVGPLHRRAEAADARDGRRRRRPGDPL
jgi:signal transduction histidine kinase